MHRECQNCRARILSLTAALTGGVCIWCARRWRHFAKDAPVLADQALWSEASRRSRSHEPGAEVHYFDEFYWCEQCAAAAVFTAAQQKHAFEVEKRYIHQTRKLCDGCYRRRKAASATPSAPAAQ